MTTNHIPSEYCVDGIEKFIASGFKIEKTTDDFLAKYSGIPAIKNASNPRKLVQNMLTLGGTGRNRDLNIANFAEAVRNVTDRQLDVVRAETAKLEREAKDRGLYIDGLRDTHSAKLNRMHDELNEANDDKFAAQNLLAKNGIELVSD